MGPGLNLLLVAVIVVLLIALFQAGRGWFWRWRRGRTESGRVHAEDALKHLFHSAESGVPGSVDSLAGALEVSRDVAADLAVHLEQRALIRSGVTGFELTDTGRAYAVQVIRTHRLWERYLADETGTDEREWHRQADRIEHRLSPAEVDALAARMGNPAFDPHGDPIPSARGTMPALRGQPLNSVEAGCLVRITHVEDEPETVYRVLREARLRIGMVLQVQASDAGGIQIETEFGPCHLRPIEAQNVTIQLLSDHSTRLPLHRVLSSVEPGQDVRVWDLSPACRGLERRRLLDLGLVPGTVVRPEMRSPAGDPTAYRIRGALIALRQTQADMILVTDDSNSPIDQPVSRE